MEHLLRKSGLGILGDIPWGTHLCQFYQTIPDLFDILVPFLKAGLESGELCVWVTPGGLSGEEAIGELQKAVPDCAGYLASGQLEIFPPTECYVKEGIFEAARVLDCWMERVGKALEKGYAGVRVTGDTMWLQKKDWHDFMDYESAINDVIEGRNLIVLCTYCLARCSASEILDVMARHESAIIRKEGVWEIIETQEQKRVSRALRQSEAIAQERLAEIEAYYHTAPVGLCVLDRDLRFRRINRRLAEMNGVSVKKSLGRTVEEVVPAMARPIRQIASHVFSTGKAIENIEFTGETTSDPGVRRVWSESWHPLFDQTGQVVGVSVVVDDVTERKRNEESIKSQMERLEILSVTAGRLLMSDDPQEIVDDLCQKVMNHLGCDVFFNFLADEEKGCLVLNAYAGIPEETAREIRYLDYGVAVCGCAARDGCRIVAENIPATPDSRTDLIRSFGITAYACHPLFSRGRAIGTLSFGTRSRLTFSPDELLLMKTVADQVSAAMERKRLLEATQERAAALETQVQERLAELKSHSDLLDLSHDAIYVRDSDGRIMLWNRGAEETYGWTANEARGKISHELLQTRFPQPLNQVMEKVLDHGRWEGEISQKTKAGRDITLASRWVAHRDGTGHIVRVLVANNDITGQKTMEQQFRQAQKIEALGTLTGGIAHDFNNILAAIIGFSEIAEGKVAGNPGAERAVQRIMNAGIRGRELVRQMLTFSRKTEQESRPLQIGSIVKETMRLLRASIPTTISIKTTIEGEPGFILGDPVQVQQVLMNLCTNAAHSMQEKGGVLSVSLCDCSVTDEGGGVMPGAYVRLQVSDTGCGIPLHLMDKIYDPFFTTKKQGEGTGLGLSVVHGIVRQHGGHVRAESQPEVGSTFTIYFPKIMETIRPNMAAGEKPIPTGVESILFVDDEEALAEMGQILLEELGYRVTARTSSREALALFRLDPSRYDLVITDQTMPELTGLELAREMQIIRPDIPIILCTGFSKSVGFQAARAAGIRGFVMKPLTKQEVAETVQKVLHHENSDGCRETAGLQEMTMAGG